MKMRIAPLWLALAGVCLAWIPPAGAQMANDLTIGNPKAMALGNAVTADETGIDSVHYNPAALTRMKGRQATVKLLTGVMDIRAGFKAPPNYGEGTFGLRDDPVANSHSRTLTPTMYLPGLGGMTDVPLLVAPLAGISINPPGSKFTFATNVYTPQALGYSRDSDSDPARYQGREVSLQRLTYFSPTLAYQVNDELSVGLSVGFSHQAVALNEDFRARTSCSGCCSRPRRSVACRECRRSSRCSSTSAAATSVRSRTWPISTWTCSSRCRPASTSACSGSPPTGSPGARPTRASRG